MIGMVMKFERGVDREKLCFTQEVLAAFDFLTKEYSFRCVRKSATFVRYESPNVFVNVYHGRGSYELGCEIGSLLSKIPENDKFTLSDIVQLADAQKETGYTFFQASTVDRVKMLVPRLSELVKKYAVSALKGDKRTFEQLRELVQKNSDDYIKDMNLAHMRKRADKAWHDKNYTKIIELYKTMQTDLNEIEKRRLKYAKKMIK